MQKTCLWLEGRFPLSCCPQIIKERKLSYSIEMSRNCPKTENEEDLLGMLSKNSIYIHKVSCVI